LAALLDQKHTKHPTNNANAALRALTDHPGVDIQGTLDEALRADDSDFSCDAVMANAPKLSPLTPAMGQFLGWISLFNI
jgi:hypothetical protein